MQFTDVVAVVLAGNDEDPRILGGVGQPSKFFMPFGGTVVGEWILRAVDGLACCRTIYLAATAKQTETQVYATQRPLLLVSQGRTPTGTLANLLEAAGERGDYSDGDHVLIVVGDLPLLSTIALERFVAACRAAEVADCYTAMIPLAAIPEELRATYHKDLMPFCGGLYLHSDVYMLRPHAVTEAGYQRFEEIIRIRRTNRRSPRDLLRAGIAIARIVGLRGLAPFVRIAVGLPPTTGPVQPQEGRSMDAMERNTIELTQRRFGPRLSIVMVDQSSLGLEFDSVAQLHELEAYASRQGYFAA